MTQTVFSIDKLRTKIGGFAKGNRYNVTFSSLPAGLSSTVNANIPFLCESVSLPTKGIASNPHDVYGPPREIPYRETFTEAALSFIVDDAFTVKRFFDKWQEKIINVETGNVNYWNNFVATINITRLSNDATSFADASDMYKIELREAYPSAVGEIALGHTQGSEILKLSVTFKYRKWMSLA
tara:strand:- start:426 stop:971 length:546 start_codon:yes stop_codon:yes gene_type:complete